jgi:hypothetical protein
VVNLHSYPVVGLGGYTPVGLGDDAALPQGVLTSVGLAYDRRWMVIDEHDQCVSPRTVPGLGLITARVFAGALVLEIPDAEPLRMRLGQRATAQPIKLVVDGKEVLVVPEEEKADRYLAEYLDRPVRLVRLVERVVNTVRRPAASPRDELVSREFSLQCDTSAALSPLRIVSQKTLGAINVTLGEDRDAPTSTRVLQPNIVLDGLPPFQEERIRRLRFQLLNVSLEMAPRVVGEHRVGSPSDHFVDGMFFGRSAFSQGSLPAIISGGDLVLVDWQG